MIVFSVLMIAAAIAMIRKTKTVPNPPKTNYTQLGLIGFLIGIVTGFLPMKQAVGTSLLIIFINSSIGFGGDLYIGTPIDYSFLLMISSMAFIGMIIGIKLSKKIDGTKLKPIFGWFVLVMGIYIIIKEFFFN